VQAGFLIVVLPLEAQVVVNFVNFLNRDITVGFVAGFPDNLAFNIGEFPGCAQMVKVVMIDLIVLYQSRRAEAAGFVYIGFLDVVAIVFLSRACVSRLSVRRKRVVSMASALELIVDVFLFGISFLCLRTT